MSDTKVLFIPSMSLIYEDNLLEIVSTGGELYKRDTPLIAENQQLKVENAKLRELVRVMAYCMQHERDCDGCRMNGADGTIEERCGCGELLDRLRELGVVA